MSNLVPILGGFILGFWFSHTMMAIEGYFHYRQKNQEMLEFLDKLGKVEYTSDSEETKPKTSSKET